MSTKEKIQQDYITAVREKNAEVKAIVQILRARLKNDEIEIKRELTEVEVLAIIRKELKQTQDSIKDSKAAGRDGTEYEIQAEYLASLLPAALTKEEIQEEVSAVAAKLDPVNKGTLMKAAMGSLKGRADGKGISAAVDAYLASL